MKNNVGTILVLFILLVIIVCSCGVLGRNDRNENRSDEKHDHNRDRSNNVRDYNRGGCNNGY
jgi:hypothetical protein